MSQQREKKLKYIMHIGSKTNDPVRLFTDQLWQSVKNASEKKLSKYKSQEYMRQAFCYILQMGWISSEMLQ